MYDVPAEIQPHKNALINEYSNVNSSVFPVYRPHKYTNPKAHAQRTMKQSIPFLGIIFLGSQIFKDLSMNQDKGHAIAGKNKMQQFHFNLSTYSVRISKERIVLLRIDPFSSS